MKKKTLAWILIGGAASAGGALLLAACSDGTSPITVKDAGKDSTVSNDGGPDVTQPPADGGADADAAVCFSKLRPAPDAGPFCYFIPKPDGGNGINCATGQTCCYGAPKGGDAGFDPSTCVNGGSAACPAPTNDASTPGDSFECAEKDDCTGNQVCCIIPFGDAGVTTGVDNFTCTFAKGEKGTRCKASCGTGELQGCQSDTECNGKTCTIVNVGTGDRLQMGYCK